MGYPYIIKCEIVVFCLSISFTVSMCPMGKLGSNLACRVLVYGGDLKKIYIRIKVFSS